LAQRLAELGVSTLRYDKRGIGRSRGDFASAGIDDHVDDVRGAVVLLRSLESAVIDAVGLIGHSEGAANATYAAAAGPEVDFLVLLAASGVPGMQLLTEQHRMLSRAAGLDDDDIARTASRQEAVLRAIRDVEDPAKLDSVLRELLTGMGVDAELEAEVSRLTTPWFRDFVRRDPVRELRRIACPILAIWGEKDTQVQPLLNLPRIREAVAEGPAAPTLETWTDVNHLFQRATTGLPDEYRQLSDGMCDVAARVSSWLEEIRPMMMT
jgi:hypothetical protein